MKNKIIYLLASCCILVFPACSDLAFGDRFLEKAPGVDVTIDTIFSSKVYAEQALTSAYSTLRYGITGPNNGDGWYEFQSMGNKLGWDNLDALTDIVESYCDWGGVYKLYYAGQYSAASENASYSSAYSTKYGYLPQMEQSWTGIRKAYLFIENVHKVPDMTESEKKMRSAEARMVVACHYHELMRHFGGIPWIDHAITTNENMQFPRLTFEKTINNIVDVLDKAAYDESGNPNMPWQVSASDDGRFCLAAALGLKVRVLLMAASPVFNDNEPYMPGEASDKKMIWYGNKDINRWQRVIDACEDFIRENTAHGETFKLVQAETKDVEGYRKAFGKGYYDRYNGEIIIATCRYFTNYPSDRIWASYLYNPQYMGNYGGGCITLDYVNKFSMNDGTPFDWNNPKHKADPFVNRDPRLYETVLVNGDKGGGYASQSHGAELWLGGRQRKTSNDNIARTSFGTRKFVWDQPLEKASTEVLGRLSNYPYLRLPEIYLAYAEALNEMDRTGEAYKWINIVRNRVGLPDLTEDLLRKLQTDNVKYPSVKEKMREEILDERAREFAYEEVRWFDLVRWKKDEVFTQDLHGIDISIGAGQGSSSDDASVKWDYTYSAPWVVKSRYWKTHWSRKWFFSAFPPDEINKDYGLVQNPGW